MIGSGTLKARVEESMGAALAPDFFDRAERYARRKLDLCNERAGRKYGEDGYGDEYLEILTEEFLYLSACALFLEQDCKRKMEARG